MITYLNIGLAALMFFLNSLQTLIPGISWVQVENIANATSDCSGFIIVAQGGAAFMIMGIPLTTFLTLATGFVATVAIIANLGPSIPPLVTYLMASHYITVASTRFKNLYNPESRPLTRSTQTPGSEVVDNNTTEENVTTLINRGTTIASDLRDYAIVYNREQLHLEENEDDSNGSDTDSLNSSNDSNISNSSSDSISSSEGTLSSPETVNVFDQYEVLRKWFENLFAPFSEDSNPYSSGNREFINKFIEEQIEKVSWRFNEFQPTLREFADNFLNHLYSTAEIGHFSQVRAAGDPSFGFLDFLLSHMTYFEFDDTIYAPIKIVALISKLGLFMQDQFLGMGIVPETIYNLEGLFFQSLRELLVDQFFQFNETNPSAQEFPFFFLNIFQELGLPWSHVDLFRLMENNFLGENMFNLLRETLQVTKVCPPLDYLRFLPEFRDIPFNRPINYADVLSHLDAARPMWRYLCDYNLINPTSVMEATELLNFINSLDLNLDFWCGFNCRFNNILINLPEFPSNVNYNDPRWMFPGDFTPSGILPNNLIQCSEEEFRSMMDRVLQDSRDVFEFESRTRDLNTDLGEGPSNYQDLNVPEVDEPYEGKGKGKAK